MQSWDTANKATELSDFSVCTTWGVRGKDLFLLGLFRRRLEYPALKRAVREQQSLFGANEVLIEDKASGTQLIQELIADGCHCVTRYQPTCLKCRMPGPKARKSTMQAIKTGAAIWRSRQDCRCPAADDGPGRGSRANGG